MARYNRLLGDGNEPKKATKGDPEILAELRKTVTPPQTTSSDTSMHQSTEPSTDRATVPSMDQPTGRDVTTSVRLPEEVHHAIRQLLLDEKRGGTLQGFLLGAVKVALADPKLTKKVIAQMPRRGER